MLYLSLCFSHPILYIVEGELMIFFFINNNYLFTAVLIMYEVLMGVVPFS